MKCSAFLLSLFLALPLAAQKPAEVPPPFEKGTKSENARPADESFEDADDGTAKLVRVQVEFVELAHTKLTELLMDEQPETTDAGPLRKKVQELVTKGEATVLETMIATAKSGQKSSSEGIGEFVYPTEYEPPALPCSPQDSKNITLAERVLMAAVPTAFETRNTGATLEIEPVIGEGNKFVDLRFMPELVWHTGNTVWQEIKGPDGNILKIQMPDFYTLRINTQIVLLAGQNQFLAALSPKNSEGKTDTTRKVMVFVKCDVLSVK